MFIFLTCIRHPDSSKNYAHIATLFEHTARSVCGQTESDFRLIVVCNKKPDIEFVDPRIIYLEVDFIVPNSRSDVLYDRGIKRLVGLLYAKNNYSVDYFMMLDADDLVSDTLVSNINTADKFGGGWWLENGYLFDFNNQRIQRKAGMNDYCGSTLILNADILYKFSEIDFDKCTYKDTYDELKKSSSTEFICEIMGHHVIAKSYFKSRGYPLVPLKKFLISWVINNGENESKTIGKLSGLALNNEWCHEFSIQYQGNMNDSLGEKLKEIMLYNFSVVGSYFKKSNN